MPFANQLGLLALLSVIPFIILYLRKPKPVEKAIPSLMFFITEKKTSKQFSFLRKLVHNLLFFIQLLALLGLSIAIAEPFIKVNYDANMENTVIIIDGSASMQTKLGLLTRFDKAVSESKKYLSGRVSLVLAEDFPLVLAEDESEEIVRDILAKLSPRATGTNIGDAMLIAKDILRGRHGRVIVLSDFLNSEGPDIFATKRVLTANDIDVVFVSVTSSAKNIGIKDISLERTNAQVFVKNYNNNEENVIVTVSQDGRVVAKSEQLKLQPKSVEGFSFQPSQGITKIEIEGNDDFDVDNTAYISIPYRKKIRVLVVTDVKRSSILDALSASGDTEIETKYFTPEQSMLKDYDIILLNQFQYVPGTFQDLSNYVERGGNLIITVQDKMNLMDFADLNIFSFDSIKKEDISVCANVFNQFTKYFEKEKCFARASKYYIGNATDKTLVIATVSDNANTPVMALKEKGKGRVFYYGIFDDTSDFKTMPSYPILWNSLINFLVKSEDVKDFNLKTGRIIGIPEQSIKTPSGNIKTTNLVIDEIGIYEFNSRKYSANLLNEKESDVSSGIDFNKESSEFIVKKDKKEINMYLSVFLLMAVSILLALEVFYLKGRGDL